MNQSVCIIILNYITYNLTLDTISSLKNLEFADYSIVVVDNASPNESAVVLEKKAEEMGFIFIKNDANLGFACGNNVGIRYAIDNGYAYSWIINNDLIINDNLILSKMVEKINEMETVYAIGPQIIDLDGIVCSPYVKRASFSEMTYKLGLYRKNRQNNNNISQTVYRLHGCCMLIRNSIIQSVGLFDERTFLYGEEELLAEKMLIKGYYSYYYPEVIITHMESSTTGKNKGIKSIKKIKWVNIGLNIYLKEYRKFNWLKCLLVIIVRDALIFFRG